MPEWSEQDESALLALLTRYVRAFDGRQKLQVTKQEIDKQIDAESETLRKLNGALALFGINTAVAGWSSTIRQAAGDDAFSAALAAGGRDPKIHLANLSEVVSAKSSPDQADGSVRDMTLQFLAEAGIDGATAAEIRSKIEAVRGGALHYKTVGMTLYRLSQEKLARREGRTWFAVSPSAGKANPGA